MSDVLNPERTGDLSALGISDRNPFSVEEPVQEEEAQATAAVEEAPVEEPVEVPVQAEPEPAADVEPSILSQLEEPKPEVSEQSEVTRLQQENLQLNAALRERRAIAEEDIRNAAKVPEATKEPESYLNSPYVQQTLRAVREENPEQYEQTLIEIAKAEMMKEVEAKEKQVMDRLNQTESTRQEAEQRTIVKQGIETAFGKVRAEGGLYAELVQEFQDRGMDSHIGRKMQQTPDMFYTETGAEDAVRSLESRLRSRIAQAQQAEKATVVQGAVTSAGSGVASTRGVNLNEKTEQKSPEDEYLDSFTGATRGGSALEFL
jgi:hypothetical protein